MSQTTLLQSLDVKIEESKENHSSRYLMIICQTGGGGGGFKMELSKTGWLDHPQSNI